MNILCYLAALLLSLASTLAGFSAADTPDCAGPGREFADREFFALCHSSSHKAALWVAYELKPEHLERIAARPTRFRADRELSGPVAADADYKGSGYTRGHLAPAADFAWSQAALRTTFLLSNAVPQHASVNSGRWAQLEAAVRRLAARCDVLHVFTGPLFSREPERIGSGGVAVPTHTFKVVLAVRGSRRAMHAAIVPNRIVNEPLDSFATTVDEVERRTGLDFFSSLDDREESELEATVRQLPALGATRAAVSAAGGREAQRNSTRGDAR